MNYQKQPYIYLIVLTTFASLFFSGCQNLTTKPLDSSPSSTILPKSQTNNRLKINYDMIFLADGEIRLWKSDISELETLLSPNILQYSLSENGRWLIAARQVDFNPDNYELVLVDLVEHKNQVVVENIQCLHDFSISPDGKRFLYIADDWNVEKNICQTAIERQGQEFGGTFYDTAYHPPFPHNLGGIIYVVDIINNLASVAVGYCDSIAQGGEHLFKLSLCISAYWTSDSQNVIWFDAKGIWLVDLTTNQSVMLYALFQDDEDHFYTHAAWSLSGKYLAIRGNSLSGNSPRRLILDWQTGSVIEAPYADFGFYGLGVHPYMIWLNDDRLLFTKPMAIAETWKFTNDRNSLILESTANLASNDSDFIAASPHQLPDGTLTYALLSPYMKNEQEHGLYQMESLTHTPKQIINLPPIKNYASDVQVLWSPDGRGAIIQYWNLADEGGSQKQFYYASNSSSILYDITQTLGKTAENIQWLP